MDADTRTVLRHMGLSLLVKGGSLGVSLLSTPAFLRYFDHNEVLGLWYTLLSVLLWVLHLDLGVGNGLRNRLTRELSGESREEARRTLSAGLFSLGSMAACLFPVGLLLIALADLNRLFGIDSATVSPGAVKLSAAIVLGGMLIRYAMSGITAAFYAVQLATVNHLLHTVGCALELIFLCVVHPADPATGLILLAVAYAILSNLPTLAAGVWLFSRWGRLRDCRPSLRLVDRAHLRGLGRIGGGFFACQICLVIIANTNELLISALFGPAGTTDYAICHRLSGIISMALSPVMTPVWSMFTKAESRGDRVWLSRSYRRLRRLGALAVGLQFLLILFQPLILRLWLGDDAPPTATRPWTVVAFALCGAVVTYSTVLSTVASGLSRLRCQLWGYAVGSVIKLCGVFLLAPVVQDWRLVVWCHTLSLLPYCIAERVALDRLLGGGRHRTEKR